MNMRKSHYPFYYRFHYIVPLVLLLLLASLALSALWNSGNDANNNRGNGAGDIGFSMLGNPAPDLTLPAYDSQTNPPTLAFADWHGTTYAINVFASWCAPCRAEAPSIARLSQTLPVIGINFRDDEADAAEFLALFGNPYQAIGVDATGQASLMLGVQAIPETLIVNTQGEIIFHQRGPIFAEGLAEIAQVLADYADSADPKDEAK